MRIYIHSRIRGFCDIELFPRILIAVSDIENGRVRAASYLTNIPYMVRNKRSSDRHDVNVGEMLVMLEVANMCASNVLSK